MLFLAWAYFMLYLVLARTPHRAVGAMSAYRKPARVESLILVEPVKEHRGPREACPMCGLTGAYNPYGPDALAKRSRACTGSSWLARIFGGCARTSPHLHQTCPGCFFTWTCAPKERS